MTTTFASTPSYIPLREDAGIKSLSKNERDFIRQCALQPEGRILRLDGRAPRQSRPTRLVLTRYPHGASGATLQWGTGTQVMASCNGEIVPPLDRPNEGIVNISVELSPSASTSFRQVPPVTNMGAMAGNRGAGTADEAQKLESNRILRNLERLMSSCLDAEALVVTPGQWVWKLSLSVVVLDAAAGNLMDACWMATLAALQHYRQPHTEAQNVADNGLDENNPLAPVLVSLDAKEGTPLPLHQVPFAVSFALIADEKDASRRKVVCLQDPSRQEEMIAAGLFTYALNVHQEVCLLDFGGGAEINLVLIRELQDAAIKQVSLLAEALQATLAEADAQAVQQRLKTLKRLQTNQLPTATNMEVEQEDNVDLPPLPVSDAEMQSSDDLEAEEEYRKLALDYNQGHVAQPLADDRDQTTKPASKGPSALLASLLQTATQSEPAIDTKAATLPPMPKELSEKKSSGMDMDSDDEEETTMQLQSEFSQVTPSGHDAAPVAMDATLPAPSQTPTAPTMDDEEVDDLAAAIKSKKKKKKKKS